MHKYLPNYLLFCLHANLQLFANQLLFYLHAWNMYLNDMHDLFAKYSTFKHHTLPAKLSYLIFHPLVSH